MSPQTSRASRAGSEFRTSIRWLTAAFGAVAAAVIAGFTISDIGSLDFDGSWGAREMVALIGAVTALGGIGWGLYETVAITTDAGADAACIASSDVVTPQNGLTGGYPTAQALLDAFVLADAAAAEAWTGHLDDPGDDDGFARLVARQAHRDELRRHLVGAAEVVSVTRLRAAVNRRRRRVVVALTTAAVGILGFVWAANEPAAGSSVVVSNGTTVALAIHDDAAAGVKARLGPDCDVAALSAIVLGYVGEDPEVVTVPTAGCNGSVRLVVSASVGTIAGP